MAYNTLEIIVSGYALDQLSRGCYMSITASNQGYILYIHIVLILFLLQCFIMTCNLYTSEDQMKLVHVNIT